MGMGVVVLLGLKVTGFVFSNHSVASVIVVVSINKVVEAVVVVVVVVGASVPFLIQNGGP